MTASKPDREGKHPQRSDVDVQSHILSHSLWQVQNPSSRPALQVKKMYLKFCLVLS